jgi:hypothetical protein
VVTLFKRVNILDAEGNVLPPADETDDAAQPAEAPAQVSTS